jgi:integrase
MALTREGTTTMATMKGRKAKVQALAARPGTSGEGRAAEAALVRIGDTAISPRTARLTDAAIKRLPLPAAGNVITWDDDVAGFGCRVTAAGFRSFVFNYRVRGSGQQRRITIGSVGDWSTGAARNEARRLRRLVDNGADPRGDHEESRDAPTMAELLDRFETEYLPRKRPTTIRTYQGMLDKHLKPFFGRFTKAADVAYEDVDRLHREITATGSRYVANRCVSLLSRIFSLAIRWKMRSDNPARGIERNTEAKRKRYLSGDELARLTKALAETDDKQFVNIVMTLLLTGARRGEVLSMRWDALHLAEGKAVWSKPSSETKQKRDHTVVLSEPVRLLLASIERDGDFVFPGDGGAGHITEIKKSWKVLLDRAGIERLRLHDLRHSFASQLVNSGASLALIGSMLGHASPVTTSRYAHLYDETQREAAERVGKIVSEANGNGNGGSHG